MHTAKKLLEQVRECLRQKHYSYRTEQAYVDWIRGFILFHGKRHPLQMGTAEIQAFVNYLAVERKVSASTMIYTHVLQRGGLAVRFPLDAPTTNNQ